MTKGKKIILSLVCVLLAICLIAAAVLYFFIGGKGVFYSLFKPVDVGYKMSALTYKAPNEVMLPYRLFVPENYDEGTAYPLVLYLHGAGERGNDNSAHVAKNSVMQTLLTKENQEKYPCIVLAPQCPAGVWWASDVTEVDANTAKLDSPAAQQPLLYAVHQLLISTRNDFNIDTSRIYITGISMGGNGTWEMLRLFPDTFAAAVPVCGWGQSTDVAGMVNTPIWAFHGAKDATVEPAGSRDMVKAIQDAGGKVVTYTEYPNEFHQSWEIAYREADLFPWLFAQKKAS